MPTDLIDRARSFGVDIVQLGDNLPVNALSLTELARLRAYATESEIDIELGTVGVEPEHLRLYLNLAVFLGARLVRTLIRTTTGMPDLGQAEKCIRCVVDEFRSAEVVLALENYEQYSTAELAALVQRVGDPGVGICLDTVNSLGALETPRQVVATLGPPMSATCILRTSAYKGYQARWATRVWVALRARENSMWSG
jgi:sugar phosphate isomerase/epimerase